MGPQQPAEQMEINGVDDYLAAMSRVVFQSGMGRTVVDAKWDGIVAAFDWFDCEKVATLSPDDVDRLCGDSRVIRNRRKIEAIIHNAATIVDIEADEGFASWLRAHDDEDARSKALRREFKFLGPAGIHEFLWIVGEPTVAGCTP